MGVHSNRGFILSVFIVNKAYQCGLLWGLSWDFEITNGNSCVHFNESPLYTLYPNLVYDFFQGLIDSKEKSACN